ncbi:hypothetical protein ITI46_15655 [Streptomyces oryzae]|uniref:Uncharacterized protein n=1 Tax=Streptomyces oryzae TaxID=1434886 RepID=A0ABS3XCI6_9ACTN|nr:hypothetical protein [Streptomyces oryzae]MBO8193091.1 hypothetical protein [Streptomyces oryzae]
MFRRSALTLAALLATTVLAAAPAAAASAPKPHDLTPREQAALKVAEKLLTRVLGGVVNLGGS